MLHGVVEGFARHARRLRAIAVQRVVDTQPQPASALRGCDAKLRYLLVDTNIWVAGDTVEFDGTACITEMYGRRGPGAIAHTSTDGADHAEWQ